MNESITIGHPSEFFRDVKKIFTSSVDPNMKMVTEDRKLELTKTPIEGVAKFDEQLRGRCYHHVVKRGLQIYGVGAICAAAAGIFVQLVFLNLSNLLYFLLLIGFVVLLVSGGLALSLASRHYVADLYLTLEGEAYQAKTVEPQGERVSVFSRAFLKTDWQPVGGTGEFPADFTKRMEEDKLVLDLALSRLLPEFEWEKSPQGQVPDSEKFSHA